MNWIVTKLPEKTQTKIKGLYKEYFEDDTTDILSFGYNK